MALNDRRLGATLFPALGRRAERVAQAAEPLMEPGEIVEASGMAGIGSMRLGRQAAIAAATAIATAGMVSVMVTPKPQPVVLTTKRFLILGIKVGLVDKPDSKIRTEIPRAELRATRPRRPLLGLYKVVELTDPEGNRVAKMRFTITDSADAEKFAQGLGPPPAGAATKR